MTAIVLSMIIINTIFLTLTHPLTMGLTLIFQTILTAALTSFFMKTFWFSYLLILIFLGGMLILFVYISSLAPNETMNPPQPQTSLTFILLMIFILGSAAAPSSLLSVDSFNMTTTFSWMISPALLAFFSFLIIFLFFVLVASIKITKFWTGPLRPNL